MAASPQNPRRIAVIGGGISGLAAAHRLLELEPTCDVTLLEASDRLGGILQTVRRDGYLIERSADMFTTREPWALDLCRRIGFTDQLIRTNDAFRKAFVVRGGRLIPVPEGFTLMSPARVWPVVKTPLLSPFGKLRLAMEFFVRTKRDAVDESLESFAVRRFGREAYQRLIQPLIGGIYTADPKKLSMAATMAQFVEMEKQHGSLIRGMRRTARRSKRVKATGEAATGERSPGGSSSVGGGPEGSGARYGLFVAPRDGMGSLIAAIAARLPAGGIRLNSPVRRMTPIEGDRWRLEIVDAAAGGAAGSNAAAQAEIFDAVVLATPAYRAAQLLRDVDRELAESVGNVSHAGAAVVVAGYRRDQIRHPLDGFGFVVPSVENRRILAGSFTSVKFDGRAPHDQVLTRTFIGGACQPELMKNGDDALKQIAQDELAELLGIHGPPLFADVVRWDGTMPQYHVGHLELVERIEAQAVKWKNFSLAGNAYRGVGIPFCIHSGEQAAERLLRTGLSAMH